jgi:tetratricopeptide (TPR) repeat protein
LVRRHLADAERRAYGWLCSIALTHDDYHAAQRCAHSGLQVCRNTSRLTGEIVSLTDVFDIARTLGDYTSAHQASEQALLLARQLGFQWGEATALWNMGDILRLRGEYALATSLLEQAVTLFHAISQSLTEIWVIQDLGRLHIFLGQYAQAQAWFERSEQLLQSLHFPVRETYLGLLPNALLAHFMGNQQQALRYAERGWQMAHELYGDADQADALVVLGFVLEQLPNLAATTDAYQQALEHYVTLELQYKAAEPWPVWRALPSAKGIYQ